MPAEGGGGSGPAVAGGAVGRDPRDLRTFRKGPFLARLDEKSRNTTVGDARGIIEELEVLLQNTGSLIGLGTYMRGSLKQAHKKDHDHVEQHWLTDWQDKNCERVLINALIKAIDLAIEGRTDDQMMLPFDCYWVAGGQHFEAVVTRTELREDVYCQVNILLFTPPANGAPFKGPWGGYEQVWSIRTDTPRPWENCEKSDEAGVITTQLCRRPEGQTG